MNQPEFQVFVIGGSRTPAEWGRILGYLTKNQIEIIPIDDEATHESLPIAHEHIDNPASPEEARPPIWLAQREYAWIGEQLGCTRQLVTQSWHMLEKIELKATHPEAVSDLWLTGPGDDNLPVRFQHEQAQDGHQEIAVDVWSLKQLAERAKVSLRVKGKVAMWEYLGITQVGNGTIDCWDKIVTSILSKLTTEA